MSSVQDKARAAEAALQSLADFCEREIRSIRSFDDARKLVATYDLQRMYEYANEAAEALETAWDKEQEANHAA